MLFACVQVFSRRTYSQERLGIPFHVIFGEHGKTLLFRLPACKEAKKKGRDILPALNKSNEQPSNSYFIFTLFRGLGDGIGIHGDSGLGQSPAVQGGTILHHDRRLAEDDPLEVGGSAEGRLTCHLPEDILGLRST